MKIDFPSQFCIDQYGGGFPYRQRTLVTSQPIRRFFGSVTERNLLRMFLNIWCQILFPGDLHGAAL